MKAKPMPQSGYTSCACPGCFEIAVSDDVTSPDLCNQCEDTCDGESSCEKETT